MKKTILSLLMLWQLQQAGKAISPHPLAMTPGISVGYVIGAGISFGADVSYTPLYVRTGQAQTGLGIYGTFTWFYANGEIYRDNWYRSLAGGIAALANDRLLFKTGVSKSVLRWGSGHVNKIKSKHLTPDLDISYDFRHNGLFAGYHFFSPGNGCFGLDINTVNLLYGAWRYRFDKTSTPTNG